MALCSAFPLYFTTLGWGVGVGYPTEGGGDPLEETMRPKQRSGAALSAGGSCLDTS